MAVQMVGVPQYNLPSRPAFNVPGGDMFTSGGVDPTSGWGTNGLRPTFPTFPSPAQPPPSQPQAPTPGQIPLKRPNDVAYRPPAGFKPDLSERGASTNPAYADMVAFAQVHHSQDGTPITADSTYQQDAYHCQQARQVVQQLLGGNLSISDGEKAVFTSIQQQVTAVGLPPSSDEDLMARRDAVSAAMANGQILPGSPFGQAMQAFSQTFDMLQQCNADMHMKYGAAQAPAGSQFAPYTVPYLINSPFKGH